MTRATYVTTSPPIDFTGWTFLAGPGKPGPNGEYPPHPYDMMLGQMLTPIIVGEFEKDPPHVILPFEWHESDGNGGPPVDDPLTIDIELPLGPNDGESPVWRISFKELTDDLVDLHILQTGPPRGTHARSAPFFEEEGLSILGRLANALRDEADRIEAIIKNGPKAQKVTSS